MAQERKKVLLFIDTLRLGGGAEKIASLLSKYLDSVDIRILYLYETDKSLNYRFGCPIERLESNNSLYNRLIGRSKKLKDYCYENSIDTVISLLEIPNFITLISRVFFRNKIRILVSIHSNPNQRYSYKMRKWGGLFFRSLIKFLYKFADQVICVSNGVRKVLISDYGIKEDKATVIYNPVEKSDDRPFNIEEVEEVDRFLFDKSSFIFITVGRLVYEKGHDFLFKAFQQVSKSCSEARLLVLGNGYLKDDLSEKLKELQLDDKIYLLGNKHNVKPYLKGSDCFVFSSIWEGFGIVLIEALAQGLPIISTDCEFGPREILAPEIEFNKQISYPYKGSFGILVQSFREGLKNENEVIEQLAKTMINMYNDKKLQVQYSKGKERAKDFYISNIIKQWEKII